jgi:MFS family permease
MISKDTISSKFHSSKDVVKLILAPVLSMAIFTWGNGFFIPFISLRIKAFGHSTTAVGCATSAFFIGLLIGSLVQNKLIEKFGHKRAYFMFTIIDIASLTGLASVNNLYIWFILRIIGGMGVAGLIITAESWFLFSSSDKNKGKILSFYKITTYTALGFSQYFLNIADVKGYIHFIIAGSIVAFASIPILLAKGSVPKIENKSNLTLLKLKKLSPLGMIGGVVAGATLGGIYGLLPIFAQELNFSIEEIAKVMTLCLFGNLFFQWPIGHLSDKFDRRKVLLIANLTSFCICMLIGCYKIPTNLFFLLIIVFGGLSFILYPLSISIASDSVDDKDFIAAAGHILLAYAAGAIIGPLIASFAMNHFHFKWLFIYFATIQIICGYFCFKQIMKKQNPLEIKDDPFPNDCLN